MAMATRPVSANALLDARECGSQCVRGARNPLNQFTTFLPSLPSLCLSRSPIPPPFCLPYPQPPFFLILPIFLQLQSLGRCDLCRIARSLSRNWLWCSV